MNIIYTQESFHKELELIQACITRMGHNSFIIKGWLLSIVAASMVLLPKDFNGLFVIGFLLLVTVVFWYLDSFFLYTEKLFRHKYDWVIKVRYAGNKEYTFNLNPHKSEMRLAGIEIDSLMDVMLSKTLLLFYGIIFLVLFIFFIVYLFV